MNGAVFLVKHFFVRAKSMKIRGRHSADEIESSIKHIRPVFKWDGRVSQEGKSSVEDMTDFSLGWSALLVVEIVVASRMMIDSKICQLVVGVMKDGTRVCVVETTIVGVEAVVGATTVSQLSRGVQDVAELLGMMVENYNRVQPNVKTYALLVECFTKYCVVREAIRHFRALKNYTGGTVVLHSEGKHGDPLSLYLRALCREGRIVELLEALEAIAKDNQPLPPRAMIVSRKYRTLVSSWIEPLQEEAELGYEIDYIARYVAEGGLTGDRKRWVPRRGKTPLDPDALGFIYSNPMETSFKQRCLEDWKSHHRKLLKILRNEGLSAMGDASEFDYIRVEERLKKIIKGPDQNALKPKAASKMVVSELKEELEAQGLPTDGTRNVLYQRVQKARRINRSRGRPLWVPPVEEEEEEVDEELDELLSRIKLEEGNTEFWRRRFLGEGLSSDHGKQTDVIEVEADGADDGDVVEDVLKEVDDEEADEEEEEVEQSESPVGDRVKDKEVEAAKPLQMIGVQLLKDSDQTNATSRKTRRKVSRISMEDDVDDDWFPEDIYGAFKELRNRKVFDVSDMYTIADAWGWTWEREIKNKPPRRWSQEWEVELAVKLMLKVCSNSLLFLDFMIYWFYR
ncbi:hypothetical protein RJ640_017430 [Escallonia rubra]|uniref:SAP domain-containing protein n=1 Tax=Escallonia rubra TaxID=112253 RepID=A0AA88RRY9_9ASTE|nr:hypothetical protein RJ640_017430 [Escallonia rubra]